MGSPFHSATRPARSLLSIAFAGAWFTGCSGRDAPTHEREARGRSRTAARALGRARAVTLTHAADAGCWRGSAALVSVAEHPAAFRDRGGHRLSLRAPHRLADGANTPASLAGGAL